MKRVPLCIWIVLLLGISACSGFGYGQMNIAELESEIGLLEIRVSQLERSYENVSNILSRMNTAPDSGELALQQDEVRPSEESESSVLDLRRLDSSLTQSDDAGSQSGIREGGPTAQPTTGAQSISAQEEPWKDKQNWRRLELGISTDAVARILGDPETITKDPDSELWEYPSGGYVVFWDERLHHWSEPWY